MTSRKRKPSTKVEDLIPGSIKNNATLPSSFFTPPSDAEVEVMPTAGRHLKGRQFMLAHKYTDCIDPTNWWMSEKLDGVRAFWNGKHIYSTRGNQFYAPIWFTEGFPSNYDLDGELFVGRGQFRSTVSIVKNKSHIDDERWRTVKFHIFDAPNISGGFEHRINTIAQYFKDHLATTVHVVTHTRCRSKEHLDEELKRVEAVGGEGLMIRNPGSSYEECRSHNLLKIKTFYDAEARVIGYKKGRGRNAGRVGALHCVMECGKKFYVGTGLSDEDRMKPPKIGNIITYRFQELTSKYQLPRFPAYVGMRIDMTEPKDADIPTPKTR